MVSINAFLHRIPYFCYISITMNLTTTTMKRIFSLFLLPILTVNCVPAQTDEARLYVKLRTGAIDASRANSWPDMRWWMTGLT